ncbi:hypothetical protein BGX38DRAFT_171979 [Terfezia claveryi]|nr:hypothetical protein BGX38DRAFT_171979 [Terfezia claveryi]
MAHQINPVSCSRCRKPFDPSEWTFTQTGDRWRTCDRCRSGRRIVKLTSKRREELEELEQQQNHLEQQPAQPHQPPACPRCRKTFDHSDWTCTPTGDRWRTCDQCISARGRSVLASPHKILRESDLPCHSASPSHPCVLAYKLIWGDLRIRPTPILHVLHQSPASKRSSNIQADIQRERIFRLAYGASEYPARYRGNIQAHRRGLSRLISRASKYPG